MKLELNKNKIYDYATYLDKIQTLFANGNASVVDIDNNKEMLHYSELNIGRMIRLNRTAKISDQNINLVNKIKENIRIIVITEGWCGDAAQVMPIVKHIIALNPLLKLDIIFRDENTEIMDMFLTNGTRSIPKYIALDADTNVIGEWGPRPTPLIQFIAEKKAEAEKNTEISFDIKLTIQKWYVADKTISTQNEFATWISSL
jgi:Thioredoxin